MPVPCLGGSGSGPRQLKNPHGIAICAGNLFVCDTGNHRLSVFALHGFVLRGFWQPPPAAYKGPNPHLANPWEPVRSQLSTGSGERTLPMGRTAVFIVSLRRGSGKNVSRVSDHATWIATDCRDRTYVVVAGTPATVVQSRTRDGNGVEIARAGRAGAGISGYAFFSGCRRPAPSRPVMRCRFGRPNCIGPQPAPKCPPGQTRSAVFSTGAAIRWTALSASPRVTLPQATYVSAALDSELYRCQWHRIILRGEIPAGARVVVSTYTAEASWPTTTSRIWATSGKPTRRRPKWSAASGTVWCAAAAAVFSGCDSNFAATAR